MIYFITSIYYVFNILFDILCFSLAGFIDDTVFTYINIHSFYLYFLVIKV